MSFSSSFNGKLGDPSGRTVCLRTAQGMKRAFHSYNISDEKAEAIVHVVQVIGILALGSVILWYCLGSKCPTPTDAKP